MEPGGETMFMQRVEGKAGWTARWIAPAFVLWVGVGCTEPQVSIPTLIEAPAAVEASAGTVGHAHATLNQDLATVRALAARYRDVEKAKAAGWDVLVPGCRDNPPVGGMGWHYLNPAYITLDLDILEPQVLIYEPQKNGRMRFVGVEYLIPFDLLPSDAEPPVLMGQELLPNFGDEVWMLHVWVGRHNPDGMFETWNPKVSCEFAD
jgi:hypothetical protein